MSYLVVIEWKDIWILAEIAYDKLARADYQAAEKAFKSFIGENPDDSLASNAYYWLGETYYVRKFYKQAARSFAIGFQKFFS